MGCRRSRSGPEQRGFRLARATARRDSSATSRPNSARRVSAKRDIPAAKRFFKKMMRADHRRLPFSISVDKNAAYPEAFSTSQAERVVPQDCKLRRVKYLNNVIEQDHRFIKKNVRASQCFKSFHTAERTLEGIEAMNMIRKGQIKRLAGSDAQGQEKFVATLFQIAA